MRTGTVEQITGMNATALLRERNRLGIPDGHGHGHRIDWTAAEAAACWAAHHGGPARTALGRAVLRGWQTAARDGRRPPQWASAARRPRRAQAAVAWNPDAAWRRTAVLAARGYPVLIVRIPEAIVDAACAGETTP